MQHGSPLWQTALIIAGIIFLLLASWRGWRAGLVRSGMNAVAIIVSASMGFLAAKFAAAPFGGLGNIAGFLAGLAVGGGIGIFMLVAIWILGAVCFKRTEHQGSGVLRLLWGAGGAFFGLLVGLAILWGGISIVRSLGAFAESRVNPDRPDSVQTRVASGLLTLKESLELGSTGRFLESVDALPPDFYELVLQVGKLTSEQKAMRRFLDYPGIQKVLQNPRVSDLMNDATVVRASKEKNIFLLLNNKSVVAALEDPALAEQLKRIDLRAALKFALESTPPSHSPSPEPSPKKRK